jgi:hypothetical protein
MRSYADLTMLARLSLALATAPAVPLAASERATLEDVLERTQASMLPLANRAAEHVPMATACCNACRTCVQTNVLALGLAGIAGLSAFVTRFAKRLLKSSE